MEKAVTAEFEVGNRLGRLLTYLAGNGRELTEEVEKLDEDLQHWSMMRDIQKDLNVIEWEELLEGEDLTEYGSVMHMVNGYDEADYGVDLVDGYLFGRGVCRKRDPNW